MKYIFNGTKIKTLLIRKNTGFHLRKQRRFFYDEEALLIDDPEHSKDEERFIILGFSNMANMLVVCHCYRENETVIRIISARKATKNEAKQYIK